MIAKQTDILSIKKKKKTSSQVSLWGEEEKNKNKKLPLLF